MNKIWTIGALLQWTQQYFAGKGIDSPRLDAEILLAHVLHKERIYLYAHYDEPMNGEELAAYRAMVKQRADRLPVAHILGTKAFMGLDFKVSEDVLIPRPETEMLVETVVAAAEGTAPAIIDIGTGSGAIILSLLHYLPQATGTGVDISPKALAIAAENGRTLGLDGRVTWIESDLFTKVPQGACDWLVSNPPYIPSQVVDGLEPHVRDHEPRVALDGGPDGLAVYRALLLDAVMVLKPGGGLFLEIGDEQGPALREMLEEYGFKDVAIVRDHAGRDRFATGTLSL